jgi:hypothetical protein
MPPRSVRAERTCAADVPPPDPAHALLTERITRFIAEVGIPVSAAELTSGTFLPGIEVRDGGLLVDAGRLRYPGDLLHEAGHLAVLDPAIRRVFGSEHGPAGIDMRQLEVQAVAWSYAAALHLELDPAIVFHADGYRGHSEGLLRSFAFGVFYGVSDLAEAGMTLTRVQAEAVGPEAQPYPHMLRWLRAAQSAADTS